MKNSFRVAGIVSLVGLIVALAACSGSGSNTASSGGSGIQSASVSSGAISAFGSVFVNGHEFNTDHANVIDDDTGVMTPASGVSGTGSLEVGMVVSVNTATGSTNAAPIATEVHVSPLARGYVETTATDTITVMGQTVQLTSGTAFSDHRACLTATTNPCSAISGLGGLTAPVGATPGTFVAIHGYLFSTGTSAQIVATLISVQDYTTGSKFKLEGQVTAISAAAPAVVATSGVAATSAVAATLTVGGETVDLNACTNCNAAYKVGDVVAAMGTSAPAASTFAAEKVRLVHLLPLTAGATIEVEGKVSSVTGTSFIIRGINIEGKGLATLPAVGDRVEVLCTVSLDGTVTANSIEHDVAAAAVRTVLAGPLTSVVAGTAANTYAVTVLGKTAIVDATTHIADRTVFPAPTFNINNFKDYLDKLKTPFVVVRALVDSTGNLQAIGFDIVQVPKSMAGMPVNGTPMTVVAVAGQADKTPSTVMITTQNPIVPNTVSVQGILVKYNQSSSGPNITKGDYIFASGVLNIDPVTKVSEVDTTKGGRLIAVQAPAQTPAPNPASAPVANPPVMPPAAINRGFIGF
jgi:hypothetical protein